MKKLLSIALGLLALSILVGCGGDDEPGNELVFDGETYALMNGYIVHWGSPRRVDGASGYHTELFLTDGELVFDEFDVVSDCDGCDLELNFDLFSDGSSFAGGDYTLWDYCNGGDLNGGWIEIQSSDVDAAGFSGNINVSGNTVTVNGKFNNWNDCSGGEGCDGCELVDVTIRLKGLQELDPSQID